MKSRDQVEIMGNDNGGNPDIFQKDITSEDFIKLAESLIKFFVLNKVVCDTIEMETIKKI